MKSEAPMNDYYIVRFIRVDCGPDEEYYYHTEQEASAHFNLFLDDDSKLYKRIEIECKGNIINSVIFNDPGSDVSLRVPK